MLTWGLQVEAEFADVEDMTVLRLSGELDHAADGELHAALKEAESVRQAGIVVDLSGVTYMESRAFGILLATRKRVGDRLVIVSPGPELMKLFRAAKLDEVFQIVRTVDEAVGCLSSLRVR